MITSIINNRSYNLNKNNNSKNSDKKIEILGLTSLQVHWGL